MKLYVFPHRQSYVSALVKAVNNAGLADNVVQILTSKGRFNTDTYQVMLRIQAGAEAEVEELLCKELGLPVPSNSSDDSDDDDFQ